METATHQSDEDLLIQGLKAGKEADFSEALDPELADRFAPNGRWATPPSLKSNESAEALMENGALSNCLDQHMSQLMQAHTSGKPDEKLMRRIDERVEEALAARKKNGGGE